MTKKLKSYQLTREILDSIRNVEGFPRGHDKDIIAISDPPRYTACPNLWIRNFIKDHGKPYNPKKDNYNREPFSFDISEGKGDPLYNAMTYHVKTPYKAIMRYLLHYTDPGDIVFDGFAGTGMTGVAAQICGKPDNSLKETIEKEMPYVKWGARKVILMELSPAATFISYNYNTSIDAREFIEAAKSILKAVEEECGWMYDTRHVVNGIAQMETDLEGGLRPIKGKINYVVWSDVLNCPNCSEEFAFWDVSVDKATGYKKSDRFITCPHCSAKELKKDITRAWETVWDHALKKAIKRVKQVPVLINYTLNGVGRKKRGKRTYNKTPEKGDLEIISKIEESEIPYRYPTDKMPEGYNTRQPRFSHEITHLHHFYTKRNLWVTASLWDKIQGFKPNLRKRLALWFMSVGIGQTKLNRYFSSSFSQVNRYLKGTLYIAPIRSEVSPYYAYFGKIKKMGELGSYATPYVMISTNSATETNIPDNSIDYIFVDPPFGGNIMYSELNFIWEGWLRVFTNNKKEAIINDFQQKGLQQYQNIMERCFEEFYRILKPNRWMTIEFHNSKNSVWMAIQEALMKAGFVVSDVRTLDKKVSTMKQLTTTSAVKQDLVISAYKPHSELEEKIKLTSGTEEGGWAFVREHLKHVPVFVSKKDSVEVVAERQAYLLFDRMVAFHVQRGLTVPISSSEFYTGLKQRFPMRDDMYFLPEQLLEYDRQRMRVNRVEQLSLTVHDERSTVQWLKRVLSEQPQTYQEIQPRFLKELHKSRHEELPELIEILEQNFLQEEEGRWYVPDPSRQADLEKIREKALLREFRMYRESKGKLRVFRSEAVRAGFSKCWQEGDFEGITTVAEKLPAGVLQEDATLLMYYDNAQMRKGD